MINFLLMINLDNQFYYYISLRRIHRIVVYLTSSCVNWAFFGMSGLV
jgi:hypothetical protein